jgi:hypothetical protein
MATERQKEAARRNLVKARKAKTKATTSKRAGHPKASAPPSGTGELSTDERNQLPESNFAFPDQRKEPLNDASHVRNAIARFDQVTDVSDADRDHAWKRIQAAAKKYDVEVEADDWRDLFRGGKNRKH